MYCEIGFEQQRLIFDTPLGIIETYKLSEIPACFEEIESAIKKGYFVAGFLSYEAGYAFEPTLQQKDDFEFPLMSFGVYDSPHPLAPSPTGRGGTKAKALVGEGKGEGEDFNLSKRQYFSKILTIQDYIKKGDTYQITFCVKKKFKTKEDPYALYQKLLEYQPVPYPAYIKHKDFDILSLSPEMFLKKNNGSITVKPMKGTLIRDGSLINNLFGKPWLHFDPKNRAENVMITDLLRNDLGKICKKGSVKTTKLFEVAKYRTVYQMTSTVVGQIDREPTFYDIMSALFPSGSVTGAPKIRSMEIIRELEPEERRIYTGTIGYISPNRNMFFNVPIRTILISHSWDLGPGNWDLSCEMGIGGGITWYSTPQGEYEECLIKARFLDPLLV